MMVTLAWPPPSHMVQPIAAAAAFQFMQQRSHQPRASGTDGMAQRDGPAIDIDL